MPDAPRNELVGGLRARITEMTEIPPLVAGELDQLKIVHPLMPDGSVLEAFKELERQLAEKAKGRNFVVAVVSIVPRGGGSFVSLNLATTLALNHHHTALLIDCGPGNEVMKRLLILPPDSGLANYLADPSLDIESIIFSSRIPRLRVIPYGVEHTQTKLPDSAAMQHLLHVAKTRYSDRFVVVDIPYSVPIETAHRLAQWCDFAVLVVPYGVVSVSQVNSAVDAIGRDRLAGIVLNRDPRPWLG